MRLLLFLLLFLTSFQAHSQLIGGGGNCHVDGSPEEVLKLLNQDARGDCLMAIDTTNDFIYTYTKGLWVVSSNAVPPYANLSHISGMERKASVGSLSLSLIGDSNSAQIYQYDALQEVYQDRMAAGLIAIEAFGTAYVNTETNYGGTILSDSKAIAYNHVYLQAGDSLAYNQFYQNRNDQYENADLFLSNFEAANFDIKIVRNGIVVSSTNYVNVGTSLNTSDRVRKITINDIDQSGTVAIRIVVNSGSLNSYGIRGYDDNGVSFNRMARGGYRASSWLTAMQTIEWRTQFDWLDSDVTIVALGTNDRLDGLSAYRDNLSSMVDTLLAHNSKVILVAPRFDNFIDWSNRAEAVTYQVAIEKGVGFYSIDKYYDTRPVPFIEGDNVHYLVDDVKAIFLKYLDLFGLLIPDTFKIPSFESSGYANDGLRYETSKADAYYGGLGNVGIRTRTPGQDLSIQDIGEVGIALGSDLYEDYKIVGNESGITQLVIENEANEILKYRDHGGRSQVSIGATEDVNRKSSVTIGNFNNDYILSVYNKLDKEALRVFEKEGVLAYHGSRYQANGNLDGANGFSKVLTTRDGWYDVPAGSGAIMIKLPPHNSGYVKFNVELIKATTFTDAPIYETLEVHWQNVPNSTVYSPNVFFENKDLGYTKIARIYTKENNKYLVIGEVTDNFSNYEILISNMITTNQSYLLAIENEDIQFSKISALPLFADGFALRKVLTHPNNTLQTDATIDGDGTAAAPFKIASQGAISGQALIYNGTTWIPQNQASGGDNWGAQSVVTDETLLGVGVDGDTLRNAWNLPTQSIFEGTEDVGLRNDGSNGVNISLGVVEDNQLKLFCAEDSPITLQPNEYTKIEDYPSDFNVGIGTCIWMQFDSKDSTYYIVSNNVGSRAKNGLSILNDSVQLGGNLLDTTQVFVDTFLISIQDTSYENKSNTAFDLGRFGDLENRYKNTTYTTARISSIDSFNRSSSVYVNEMEAYLGTDSLQVRHAFVKSTHNNNNPAIELTARTDVNGVSENTSIIMTGEALAVTISDESGYQGAVLRRPNDLVSSGLVFGTATNIGKLSFDATSFTEVNPVIISTNSAPASFTIPISWSGIEGDVITLINQSGVTKDVVGHINNVTPTTVSVLDGFSLRLFWDEGNDTWWVLN